MCNANAIGELNERSLHRALKERYAVAGSATEQPVDGFVADVVIGDRIIEVQTGMFSPLKRKLPRLLDRYAVTLVHPIAKDRYIVKVQDDPRAPTTRRKSPLHGTVYQVFSALVSIPALLEHPRLTLHVVMTVEEHIRAWDGTRRRRRGGWVTHDRRLVDIAETHAIDCMADLFALIDAALPETFTSRDLATTMSASRRLGQQAAFCLREAGVTEICGKQGNALVYRRANAPSASWTLRRPPRSGGTGRRAQSSPTAAARRSLA